MAITLCNLHQPELGAPLVTPALGHSRCFESEWHTTDKPHRVTAEVVVAGNSKHGVCVQEGPVVCWGGRCPELAFGRPLKSLGEWGQSSGEE